MEREKLYLRRATIVDTEILYKWRNDSVCRKNSINSEKIEYNDHCIWLSNKLNSDSCDIFICMKGDKPIGQVRVDYENEIGKISYSIASDFRGNNYGSKMLELLEYNERLRRNVVQLCAMVKHDNVASQKCFTKLNYSKDNRGAFFYYSKLLCKKE